MNVEIRENSILITGYVNATERLSRPIRETLRGKVRTFLEKIKSGAFRDALKRNDDVLVLLNHDYKRQLATTKDGTAKLTEDNIGLKAEITITDREVIEKAKQGKLSGWSFGFYANDDTIGTDGVNETRTVNSLDLVEVSILDDTKVPAYYGTLIEARERSERNLEIRAEQFEVEKEAEPMAEEPMDEPKDDDKIDINELANIIALKVVEVMKTAEAPVEEMALEEVPKDEEGEAEAEPEEEPKEEEPEEKECKKDDDEKRSVDYSAFEERLNDLSLNN